MTGKAARRFTCGMCGREFREDRSQPACRSCPLTGMCDYVRCPHCGHDNPARPGWLRRAVEWIGERAGREESG